MPGVGSAVVIVIPEAEVHVGELRQLHDPVASGGVPPHLTVLYPFRREVDDATVDAVGELATGTQPFELTFDTVEMFSDGVVYLAPRPDEPVRQLTREFAAQFPDCPPYEGLVDEPTPHLTVGHRLEPDVASQVMGELERLPPFESTVTRLTLLVEAGEGRWSVAHEWPLGTSPR